MNTAIISGRLVRDPGYTETQNEKGLHKIGNSFRLSYLR
mgnify:CR=1 FL=1